MKMKMGHHCVLWSLFVFYFGLIAVAVGDVEDGLGLLTFPINDQDICKLDDVMRVRLSQRGQPVIDLSLRVHDVIGTSPRHVYIMKAGRLQAVTLGDESAIQQSYIDDNTGAAFVVTCAHHGRAGRTLKLEGSFYQLGVQYRVTPSPRWAQSVVITDGQLSGTYVIKASSPRWVQPYTQTQAEALKFAEEQDSGLHASELLQRQRRQIVSYYVDILPVVDYPLYQIWQARYSGSSTDEILTAIRDYLSQMFASVALRLDSLEISQRKLVLRMVEPYIATTEASSPVPKSIEETDGQGHVRVSATTLLAQLESWVQANLGSLARNDHVMLLTGYTIYGSNDAGHNFNVTQGLANVGTICQGSRSVSLVEDRAAFQSEGVASHEFGHSLGAVHDGSENACLSDDRYIMTDNFKYSRTARTLLHPWKFSPCSSQEIAIKLAEVESDSSLRACLTGQTGSSVTPHMVQDANQVCRWYYGQESFACRGVDLYGIDQVCGELYCRKPGTNTCVWMSTPMGTCCGNGKACSLGECKQLTDPSLCAMDETCPLGDQPGIVVNGLTCAQIPSCFCYRDDVAAKCCDSCANKRINTEGCFYGDKQCTGCDSQFCGAKLETGVSYSFMCCHTCDNVRCSDRNTINLTGATYSCAQFLETFGASWCYNTSLSDQACCSSCEKLRNKQSDGCQYGDNNVAYNCPALMQLSRDCTPEEEVLCCETCPAKRATTPPPTAPPTVPPSAPPTESPQTTRQSPGGSTGSGGSNGSGSGQGQQPCTGAACDASFLQGKFLLVAVLVLMVLLWKHGM